MCFHRFIQEFTLSFHFQFNEDETEMNISFFQANRTAIILHDIWNKYAEKRGIDKKLLYLQFISMRFLICKLKFTAYGFFQLDWSFLHTVSFDKMLYVLHSN